MRFCGSRFAAFLLIMRNGDGDDDDGGDGDDDDGDDGKGDICIFAF